MNALFVGMAAPVDRLVAYDHSRVLLPWFSYARGSGALARLRRRALSLGRADACKPGFLRLLLASVLHPLRVVRETLCCMWRMSRDCRRFRGVSYLRQFLGCLHAGLRHNLGARLYYHFHFYEIPTREWALMVSHEETTRLLLQLRERTAAAPAIWGKVQWHAFCLEHDIPTVPVLAVADGSQVRLLCEEQSLLGRDLFLKPDEDYSGRGGIMLTWTAEAAGWLAEGAVTGDVSGDALIPFLQRVSSQGIQVLQPRLRTHPVLAPLASRALLNARVLTYRARDGAIVVVCATLRCPPGDQVTSDVVGGTLQIPMDPGTGTLGRLHLRNFAHTGLSVMPGTGAQCEGLVFPEWQQSLDMVRRAHVAVHWLPCVGWDLIASDEGILLLEGNVVWSGELAQQYGLCPFGSTGLPEALLTHLEAGDSAKPPAS